MKCNKCGAVIDASSTYCPSCKNEIELNETLKLTPPISVEPLEGDSIKKEILETTQTIEMPILKEKEKVEEVKKSNPLLLIIVGLILISLSSFLIYYFIYK